MKSYGGTMSNYIYYKDIVLLAKSKKNRNYCVAGINIDTEKWDRLVSNDDSVKYALTKEQLSYQGGELPKLLDVMRVYIKRKQEHDFQVENYEIDERKYFKKLGTIELKYLITLCNKNRFLFFNSDRRISSNDIARINAFDLYSLELLHLNRITIYLDGFDDKKIKCRFIYNNIVYENISITDIEFLDKYLKILKYSKNNEMDINDVVLVCSLGEEFHNYHYKLIASVIKITGE